LFVLLKEVLKMTTSTHRVSITYSGSFVLPALAVFLISATSHPVHGQASAAPEAAQVPTLQATPLRADVRRVAVDVVVTDPQGRPVTGLTQEDFKVVEDDTPQKLLFFDMHTVAPETGFVAPEIPPLPPNTFLNLAKAPESGTPTVILYDALNTPLAEQEYGHKQILDFIKHRRPGTQIAIFVLGAKLHLLQGFTEDTDLLSAALASKKGSPQTTTLLAPSSDLASTPMSDNPETTMQAPTGGGGAAAAAAAAAANSQGAVQGLDPEQVFNDFLAKSREMDALNQERLQDQRVEITLNALTDIGRFLASLPGRKDLIWLSSGFPVDIFPNPAMTTNNTQHDRDMRDYSVQVKQATDLLNLSHVSVYPVDVRGLRVNSDLTAASNAAYGSNPNFGGPAASLQQTRSTNQATTSTSMNLSQQTFIQGDVATRATMDSIAGDTGGHAFYGTNGLQEAVNSAMISGSTYYSLTYAPTNPKYDGGLRHIKVTLKKSGCTLSYRKTYYADDLEAVALRVADAPQSPLTPSLERGTPLSHGLFLEAQLEASGPPAPATPAQMQVLSQYEALQTKKAKTKPIAPVLMQQYLISYGLIARQLEVPVDASGAHQASIEFGLISYDEDGRKLNGVDTHIADTIPAARYAQVLSNGYHVVQSIAVPVTAASIRIAVRDTRANRVGTLEVQLPLATAEARTAAKTPAK
jgi:VWFA-related protein